MNHEIKLFVDSVKVKRMAVDKPNVTNGVLQSKKVICIPKVVPVGLNLSLLFQEPLRPELLRLFPGVGVIGEPPCVNQDFALRGYIVAAQLGILEVHVRDQKWNRHPEAEGLFDYGLEIGQPWDVRLRDLGAGAQHGVKLVPELLLDFRVVHQLCNAPFY